MVENEGEDGRGGSVTRRVVIEFRDESGARIGRLVFPNACKFPRKRRIRRIAMQRTLFLSLSNIVVVVVVDQRASLITLRILIIAVLSLSFSLPFSFQRNSLLLFEIEQRVDETIGERFRLLVKFRCWKFESKLAGSFRSDRE